MHAVVLISCTWGGLAPHRLLQTDLRGYALALSQRGALGRIILKKLLTRRSATTLSSLSSRPVATISLQESSQKWGLIGTLAAVVSWGAYSALHSVQKQPDAQWNKDERQNPVRSESSK